MSDKKEEPKRPYYEPKQKPKPQPKPANVTPVDKWSIANVLFWGRGENGKLKPPTGG